MGKITFDRDRIKRFVKEALGDRVTDSIPARLGHPDPASVPDAIRVAESVAGAANFVYIRGISDAGGDLQGVSIALNEGPGKLRREDMVYGAFIKVRRRKNGGWIVDGTDDEQAALYAGTMNVHPQTSVVLSQFDNLLLQPTSPPSMRFIVGYGASSYNGYPSMTVSKLSEDYTGSGAIPSTPGESVFHAIEYSPIDEQILPSGGSPFTDTGQTNQEAFTAGYTPAPTWGALFLGWIKLTNGMTEFRHIRNIIPAHELLSATRIPRYLQHVIRIPENTQIVIGEVTLNDIGEIQFGRPGEGVGGDPDSYGEIIFV